MVPPGQGDGQVRETLAELRDSGFHGYLSLEPHLAMAGRFGGFSGPDGFRLACGALKNLLADLSAQWNNSGAGKSATGLVLCWLTNDRYLTEVHQGIGPACSQSGTARTYVGQSLRAGVIQICRPQAVGANPRPPVLLAAADNPSQAGLGTTTAARARIARYPSRV